MHEQPKFHDLQHIPLIGKRIKETDDRIQKEGLVHVVAEFLQKLRVEVRPSYPNAEVAQAIKNEPTLIIVTHQNTVFLKGIPIRLPSIIQMGGVISTLPKEKQDVSLISNVEFSGIGVGFQKHSIPIYGVDAQSGKKNILWEKSPFHAESPSPMEVGRLNMESLRDASERLRKGGLVLIAPDGAKDAGTEWFTGLGRLVEMLKNDQINIIFASVDQWHSSDNLRVLPGVRTLLGKKQLPVRFSELHGVQEYLVPGTNKKEITQQLQRQYQHFLASNTL